MSDPKCVRSRTNITLALALLVGIAPVAFFGACGSPARGISTNPGEESSEELRAAPAAFERRGCCTNKGGVCGCSAGKAQCCDGSLSPRCACN